MNKEFLSREALSARVKSNREAKSPSASDKRGRGFRRFSQEPLIVRKLGEASATDSLGLYRQILYKVQGHLNPATIKEKVQAAIGNEELLRSSFFVENGMLCQAVFPDYQMTDILCWDHSRLGADNIAEILAAAMEGDMRQGLGADEIFRLSAYQTAKNAYAVLVTAENILAENFDFRQIWAKGSEAKEIPAATVFNEKEARKYWDAHMPEQTAKLGLPFGKPGESGNLKTYRLTLPKSLTKELFERTAGNRENLTAALASAWELTLNGEGSLAISAVMTNGRIAVCPLFLPQQISTTENLVTEMAGQIEKSLLFSFGLESFSCDCLLSFDDFLRDGEYYPEAAADPMGHIIRQRAWSSQDVPLSLYFAYDDDLTLFFLYEYNRFKPFGVELLARRYMNVISRLLRDYKQPLSDYATIYYQEDETPLYEPLRSSQGVFELLHAGSLFRDVPINRLKDSLGKVNLTSKLQGDRISGEVLEKNVIYLARGKVSVSIFDSNGWCNILGIKQDNTLLNESLLLPQRSAKLALEIVSDDADLIYIPLENLHRLLYNEPSAVREMMFLALAEMEKYQKLWAMM